MIPVAAPAASFILPSILVAILALAVWFRPRLALLVALAFASRALCSAVFGSGISARAYYEEVVRRAPGLRAIQWGLRSRIDVVGKSARMSAFGLFRRTAIYTGRSCGVAGSGTVSTGHEIDDAGAMPEIADLFREQGQVELRGAKAIVVMANGRIVAERYSRDCRIHTPMMGWSLAKSLTNAIIGVLVRQGRVSLTDPAPIALWSEPGDRRSLITIDHLLRHTAGLCPTQTNSGFDRATRVQFLERDSALAAISLRPVAKAGERWAYNDVNYIILARIIRDVVGGPDRLVEFIRSEISAPTGINDLLVEFDSTGTPALASFVSASARDWARLGQLYLDDGIVGGRRVLPPGWVEYTTRETTLSTRGYGAGFWINSGSSAGAIERRDLGMPSGSYFAQGVLGQYIIVIPDKNIVIAKMGHTNDWRNFGLAGAARLALATSRRY